MTADHDGSTDASTPTNSHRQPLDVDRVFSALADRRRRCVVYCLRTYGSPMSLTDLADEIALLENDEGIADVPDRDVTHAYVSLYHKHVPALAAADVVEYDRGADTVSLSSNATHLRPLLEAVEDVV